MKGSDLRKWRDSQGLKQRDVADMLNGAMGRAYTGNVISVWERGDRPIPQDVLAFFTEGASTPPDEPAEGVSSSPLAEPTPSPSGEDVPPTPQGPRTTLALVPNDPALAKACEELWDMIGFSLVIFGQGLGKPALRNDGQIICGWEDGAGKHTGMKRELGVAYGKLAERNRTFQRIVVALSQESVWAEIAVVTVKLCKAMYDNHVNVSRVLRERAEAARMSREPQYEEPQAA